MKAAVMPVAEAIRKPGRTLLDAPFWVIKRCPHCARRHVHTAPVTLTELVLLAPCGDGTRSYRVREVSP